MNVFLYVKTIWLQTALIMGIPCELHRPFVIGTLHDVKTIFP